MVVGPATAFCQAVPGGSSNGLPGTSVPRRYNESYWEGARMIPSNAMPPNFTEPGATKSALA